jgi:PTS system N-acetylglucosamine-specific IIC component
MVIMNALGVRLGFSFSAGLFDYVLNFSHAQRPLLLVPIGAAYFVLYYAVFRVVIVRLNLATPGREADETATQTRQPETPQARAAAFVLALGGAHNLTEVAACTTRLRLVLADNTAVDEAALKRLGARGILRASSHGLQVVLGPIADQVAGEIRAAVRAGPLTSSAPRLSAAAVLAALGGRDNVLEMESLAGRVAVQAVRIESVDETALAALGVRGVARSGSHSLQLLVLGSPADWLACLRP